MDDCILRALLLDMVQQLVHVACIACMHADSLTLSDVKTSLSTGTTAWHRHKLLEGQAVTLLPYNIRRACQRSPGAGSLQLQSASVPAPPLLPLPPAFAVP